MRRLDDIGELDGRVVVVRADLNVPLDEDGGIVDDTRIAAIIPTLERLRDGDAYVVVLSHLGRPAGVHTPAMTLRSEEHTSELQSH